MPDASGTASRGEVIDIKPSWIKLLLSLLGSAGFVAIGIFLARQPFRPKPGSTEEWLGFSYGYVTAAFFGLCFLAILWQLMLANRPAVRITADGIQDLRSRQPMVAWSNVSELGWWTSPGATLLVLAVRPDAKLSEAELRQIGRNRMIGLDGLAINTKSLRMGRKRLLEVCEAALHAARAGGGRARPSNSPRSASGDGTVLAYVVLGSGAFATRSDVLAAIRKRVPDFAPDEAGGNEAAGTMLDVSGGHFTALMFIDAPNPISDNESFIRDAWWWPDASSALAQRKAHVVVSEGGKGDAKAAFDRLARVTAGIVECHPAAIGVIVGADSVWPAKVFLAGVDGARNRLPVEVLVTLRGGQDRDFPKRDGSPSLCCITLGLEALGLMEIEVRGWDGEFQKLHQFVLAMATYMLGSERPVNDGDTIAIEGCPPSKVMHDASTLVRGTRVYRVHVTPEALPSELGPRDRE